MVAAWLWTIALNGALGLAGYGVARFGLRQPRGVPRVLAAIALAWAWATLGMELLGAAGLLARLPLLLWTCGGLGISALLGWNRRGAEPPPAQAPPAPWEPEAVLVLGLTIWAAGLIGAKSLLYPVKVVSDGPIYHLYFAARWWKSARLLPIAAPFGETAATYFPAVGDLWFTWLMAGWGGDRLAKVGQAPFQLVAALAAYGLARRLGIGRSAALLATLWFTTSTPFILFAFEPNVDTIFVAGYLLSAYFFLGAALGVDSGPSFALGALAAGCALGAKAIGVVFVPVLLALAAFGLVSRRAGPWRTVLGLLALAVLPLVTVGYWYGRNVILTGNPLYPLRVEALSRVWLDGWYAAGAMRHSKYYLPMTWWRAGIDTVLAVVDPRSAPLWVASLAGAWAWGRRSRLPSARWIWLAAALALLNAGLYWFAIPYRTQQRFLYPALGLSVVPLAATLDRARWLRALAALLLALHLLTPQGWPFASEGDPIPWDLSPRVPNALDSPIPLMPSLSIVRTLGDRGAALTAFGVLMFFGLGALVVAWTWRRALGPSGNLGRQATAWLATWVWFLAVLTVRAPAWHIPAPTCPTTCLGWGCGTRFGT